MRTKKAQQLTLTTLFVLFIFFLIITLFFDELLINPKMDGQRYQHVQREASRAAGILVTEGYPVNWTNETVQRAGLLTNGVYNKSKATNLSATDYGLSKDYLGIMNNYLLNITNNDTTIIIGEYGSEAELLATNQSYLVTQTRTVPSSTGTATFTLYVYRGEP